MDPDTRPDVAILDAVMLVVTVLSALIPDDESTTLPIDADVEIILEIVEFVTLAFVVIIDEAVILDVFVESILPIVAFDPVNDPDEADVEITVPNVELVADTLVAETLPDEIPVEITALPADT